MIDKFKIGNQIALLRREKGMTGEQFAEQLGVSPQAVSKWENGKNLPETSLLPKLADLLGVSIDSILVPQRLFILRAVFTNGIESIDVTSVLSRYINGGKLDIAITPQFIGTSFNSERIAVLTVKYQTQKGTFFAFAPQGDSLVISSEKEGQSIYKDFNIVGAWYGNKDGFKDVMFKIKHYNYFHSNNLYVDHETFPSNPATDTPEYLTIVFLNQNGIHTISCQENEVLTYSKDNTELLLKDTSTNILSGIIPLSWGNNIDCCWGGSMYAALKYVGESYTYEQIMGISGACYRINFTEAWDWSTTDALVAFDYSTPLFKAIGYEQIWSDRLNKDDRIAERKLIVNDIKNSKPIVAINLRTAAEWGVITGYADNGKTLYCRTYFDNEGNRENNEEYLETEYWPFMLIHFGEKVKCPSDKKILKSSLETLINSFYAQCERGYWQGENAYLKWIEGLHTDSLWDLENNKEDFYRRTSVNQWMLRSLIDERRCASVYLKENNQVELAEMYHTISKTVSVFYGKWLDKWDSSVDWRYEEIELLNAILDIERNIVKKAEKILNLL